MKDGIPPTLQQTPLDPRASKNLVSTKALDLGRQNPLESKDPI